MSNRRALVSTSLILVALSACLSSCVSSGSDKKAPPPTRPVPTPQAQRTQQEPIPVPVQTAGRIEAPVQAPATAGRYGTLLSEVKVSTFSFNPQLGQKVTIAYKVAEPASVEVGVYDPDFGLVRTLRSEGIQTAGPQGLSWDGRDAGGAIVPDEAYFFVVTAKGQRGSTETYDPTLSSGGEGKDITKVSIDPASKAITYRLPEMGRVLIRQGVQDGPLLNTLVDWKPRVAGEITENWNGRDKDDMIDLLDHPRFKMLITYLALPENSVITYGNRQIDFRQYEKTTATHRPVKERPARKGVLISPHYLLSRTVDRCPGITMVFPDAKAPAQDGVTDLKGKALVRVDIDDEDKDFFVNQQYEITVFLDYEFHAEQEVGHAPFNWVWDLSDVKPGEHTLTVNMTGFKDQIGVLSKKVRVVK